MQVIHKFPVKIAREQSIELPAFSKILSVQLQNGSPCIWVFVDYTYRKIDKKILCIGTGHEFVQEIVMEFIGTIQLQDGTVWHFFYI